ncbi:hypothetical protein ACJA88_009163 [Fusarium oxysporum]
MPSTLPEAESPYRNFVRGSNEYHNGKEPPYTPITMVDRNGSVLCETDQFDLLGAIIYRDDVTTLEQHLDIALWVIEEIEELPLYYSFFYIAVSHGSLGALKTLLSYYGAFPSDVVARAHEDSSGKPETVLSMAFEWAGSKMIERLVSGGADVHAEFTKHSLQLRLYDEQDYIIDNVTAIHMASFRGNFVALETLLDQLGDTVIALEMVSSCDSRGSTPLHWAARNNLYNPNLQEIAQNIKTPIHLILDIDPAIVNVQDIEGNTALHYAARYFGENVEVSRPIFQSLCDKGADSSIHNNRGETPLHDIFSSDGTDETIDKQILSLLLAHGAKVNDIDHAGNTPLHITVRRLDYHNIMSFLIERGGDATIGNSANETPVHVAASGDVSTPVLAEKVEIQNGVLTTLTNEFWQAPRLAHLFPLSMSNAVITRT